MALTLRSRSARWAVPGVAAVVLIGVGPALTAITADAHGSLPPRTAAQLLADVHDARLQGLSGTVVETSDLGLPSLPALAGGDSTSFSSLVSGSHTMRLWYAAPDRTRVALLGQLGESDLVRNGTDLWSWSSHGNTVTHWTVPAEGRSGPMAADPPNGSAITPQQAAEAALRAIDPSTRVTTDPTASVAGRPAYQLDLVPRDRRSLVGSVRIAIDGETHVPTRVQVFARDASHPAFEVGFTSFSTATPPDSVFAFTPPPGATVKQGAVEPPQDAARSGRSGNLGHARPEIVGKGWTSVVVAPLPQDPGTSTEPRTPLVDALPRVEGAWGAGRLLRSSLFSAVITEDGRVAVGAVPPRLLYAALER